MDKVYYLYAINKKIDVGRISKEIRVVPYITIRYKLYNASILLGRCKDNASAREKALQQEYIYKNPYGGYCFTEKGIKEFI